jgi:hypothetical protein
VVDSLISEAALKHKEVAVCLTPPLASLGFFSPSLAPKEEKRNVPELIIYLAYDLAACYGADSHGVTRVGTGFSGQEYALWPDRPGAQAVRTPTKLRGLPAPALLTAGVVCASAQGPGDGPLDRERIRHGPEHSVTSAPTLDRGAQALPSFRCPHSDGPKAGAKPEDVGRPG